MDLTITRGDTKRWKFEASQDGDPLVLDGGKVYFTAKLGLGDPDSAAVIRKESPSSGITLTAGTNQGEIKLVPADTSNQPDYDVELLYDLQLKDSNGDVYTLESGKLKIVPDVGRTTP